MVPIITFFPNNSLMSMSSEKLSIAKKKKGGYEIRLLDLKILNTCESKRQIGSM